MGVSDGDTIKILDAENTQHKIRLDGIDAPESYQAYGTKSKQALSGKVFGQAVRVEWDEQDKYGRIVGNIYLDDRHINMEMVTEGWAWHFKKYSSDEDLAAAEVEAREKNVGLWADPRPIPPWDFRRNPTFNDSGYVRLFVTPSGKKYHREGCPHLGDNVREITLETGRVDYEPCKKCQPPK